MLLKDAAWADGVAAVSQRPIPPKGIFRYKFQAAPAGTFWYHSHTGAQLSDGMHGPLIVQVTNSVKVLECQNVSQPETVVALE